MCVGEPETREDLRTLVRGYLGQIGSIGPEVVDSVVEFYIAAKAAMVDQLVDSAGQRPQYRCSRVQSSPFRSGSVQSGPVKSRWSSMWRPSQILERRVLRGGSQRIGAALGAVQRLGYARRQQSR
eukprot:4163703-Pyramimonas_sp.AAC.1